MWSLHDDIQDACDFMHNDAAHAFAARTRWAFAQEAPTIQHQAAADVHLRHEATHSWECLRPLCQGLERLCPLGLAPAGIRAQGALVQS